MRVFRTTYKDKNGVKQTAQKWYIELRDHLDIIRRFPAFTDREQSAALGRQIERLVRFRVSNDPLDPAMCRWLEQIPNKLRRHFVRIGLLDAQRAAGGKPLTEHLADFEAVLKAQGKSASHIAGTVSRIKSILNGCGFVFFTDINGSKVIRYLGDKLAKRSATTRNHYLTAFKAFLNWLVRDNRASMNPIAYLGKEDAESEQRGALTREQFTTLIKTTMESGTEIIKVPDAKGILKEHNIKMSGKERGMLYLLAGSTGFRRGELLTLRWKDFDFGNASVNISGEKTKNRKAASQPLPKQTADLFKKWQQYWAAGSEDKIFPNFTRNHRPSEIIKADLERAKLPTVDYAGRKIDFHSLRNSYISFLAETNTPPKLIQHLARHSNTELTFNTYARVNLHSEQAAVAGLPTIDIDRPQQAQAQYRKTGTDDISAANPAQGNTNNDGNSLAQNLALVDGEGRTVANYDEQKNCDSKSETQFELGRSGVEPPTHGFSVRCSTT